MRKRVDILPKRSEKSAPGWDIVRLGGARWDQAAGGALSIRPRTTGRRIRKIWYLPISQR
ncbi:MAG: hypothetical protein Q4A71_08475 [Actinomycetaceae bacterium]|nr:hypothetical protein [Actinomycetaceae bacterium]